MPPISDTVNTGGADGGDATAEADEMTATSGSLRLSLASDEMMAKRRKELRGEQD